MRQRNKLLVLITFIHFSFLAIAQDVSIVLLDMGCNICAGGYGTAINEVPKTSKRKLTLIVKQREYYSNEQAEELLRQQLGLKVEFSVVISDSLVSVLTAQAPAKYKKDYGGLVFLHTDARYDYFSTLSALITKEDMLHLLDSYTFSHEVLFSNVNKTSRKAFLSCPICTHAVIDTSLYVLSVYAGTLSQFKGPHDTAATVFALNEAPLFPSLYASIMGDTSGCAKFLESASFSPVIPIGVKAVGDDDLRVTVTYYDVVRDSSGNVSMGGAKDGIIHLKPSNGTVKLYPVKSAGMTAPIQSAGWIMLNDSQLIFQFSEYNGKPRNNKPLFGLFQYERNQVVFKRELDEFILPKTKTDPGFIAYFRNKYAVLPAIGKVINCVDWKEVYQLDFRKTEAFINKAFKQKVEMSKAWWMDYISIDSRVCRIIFSYEDRLYVLFIDQKTSEVITGQSMQEQSLKERTSATKMYRNAIYYITKQGNVSCIRLN